MKSLFKRVLELFAKGLGMTKANPNLPVGTVVSEKVFKTKHRSEIRSPNRLSQKGKRRRARQRKSSKR